MNREKLMQQAKILRDKKFARMARLGKQLRPEVEAGVVKYKAPTPPLQRARQFAAPPPPTRSARTVVPQAKLTEQQTEMRQQQVTPTKVIRKQKGCSGCRRKG